MRIAIVSDSHLTARTDAFNRNWDRACAWIGEQAPDLVVHLGDISADGAGDPAELAAARQAFDALRSPFRALPGNHDIGDNPKAPDMPDAHHIADHPQVYPGLMDLRLDG